MTRTHPPTILTPRLILRPLARSDAATIIALAGNREVAATTRLLPHPYLPEHAEQFLELIEKQAAKGELTPWAVTLVESDALIGVIGLRVVAADQAAELGYWFGRPSWGQGYASEAAGAVVDFGFETLQLNRIFASCMVKNPASRRVLEKVGMTYEGMLRQHIIKWGEFEDIYFLGVVRADRK